MKIGYARASAPHQNLDRQLGALRAERCARIFREKVSGRDLKARRQLAKAIDFRCRYLPGEGFRFRARIIPPRRDSGSAPSSDANGAGVTTTDDHLHPYQGRAIALK
jgi:hypothetical protein